MGMTSVSAGVAPPQLSVVTIPVVLPSGAPFDVATPEEADYVDHQVAKYMEAFTFVNPGDLSDLDQIVRGELLCWRWDLWMSRNRDYDDCPIDIRHYADAVKKYSTEIRQLKSQLGMDRQTRERTTGDGSIPEFIERILLAARLQNIHRCNQLDKALELAMQLRTIATIHRNSDDEERRLTRCTSDDIVEWILEVFDPEMQAVDDYFQTNVQSTWVGTL